MMLGQRWSIRPRNPRRALFFCSVWETAVPGSCRPGPGHCALFYTAAPDERCTFLHRVRGGIPSHRSAWAPEGYPVEVGGAGALGDGATSCRIRLGLTPVAVASCRWAQP